MPEDTRKKIARNSLLLKSLPEDVASRLLERSIWRKYDRGQNLFLQGEAAQSIHIVVAGWVKLFRMSQAGGETVVHVFSRGESFGEAVAFRGGNYPVSAEAVMESETLEVPTAALLEMMRNNPETAESILASAFVHLHALVTQLEQLKAETGAERTAKFLLEFCDPDARSAIVTLPYDKGLIAGRLGMKPESLSRAFTRLRSVGVRVSGNLAAIDDVAVLRDYTGSDPTAKRVKSR
ncbi:Crp/Fnr family transcriptional regulator [Aliiruegeria sabulilitoris]|uniref:Crp/Fnr family transcriptional regulator n=1 Tax=Aliiruegeria sabulilitoris TaxID=1510458 RepID=UPI0008315BD5|nr:Crp/Fnr family transcriptional regulator [Aliiruegeria sabulilitoris]NDR58396.1 Crp/Fnr family transcriptional regulator [Pseudoruegeria sp. M32A2M]